MPAHSRSRHQRVRLTRLYTFDFRCRFASPPSSAGSAAPSAGLSFSPQRERFRGASPAGRGCSTAAPVTPTIATYPEIPRRSALAVASAVVRRASDSSRDGSQRRKGWVRRRIHCFDVAQCHREQPAATFQSKRGRKALGAESRVPGGSTAPACSHTALPHATCSCYPPIRLCGSWCAGSGKKRQGGFKENAEFSSTHEREARCGPPFSRQQRRPACSRPHCW